MAKLNDMIDRMYSIKQEIKELDNQKKKLNVEFNNLQGMLLESYEDVGTDYARGALASATRTESLVPQIEDWGLVSDWIMENDGIYLCHRRVSSGPWKELQDAGTNVPGIIPYTKVAISLRKLGD